VDAMNHVVGGLTFAEASEDVHLVAAAIESSG
jgi:hypothetical protein